MVRIRLARPILAAVLAAACAAGPGGRPERWPPGTDGALTVASPTPEPSASATTATPLQVPPDAGAADALDVLASGDPVPFAVCYRLDGWTRATADGMSEVFTFPKFGDGQRPFPFFNAIYLSSFIWDPMPSSNSGEGQIWAFAGIGLVSPAPTPVSDPSCSWEAASGGHELWLAYHEVLDVRRRGHQTVFRVRDAPGRFEQVLVPAPQGWGAPAADGSPDVVQVVDETDTVRHTEARAAGNCEVDASGALMFVWAMGPPPFDSLLLPNAASGPRRFTLFGDGNPTEEGAVTVVDEEGNEIARASWPFSDQLWQPLASFDLPRGRFRLRFTGPFDEWQSYLLLRDDLPLPP